MKQKYLKDQHIEAYYDNGWYPGVIHRINEDGTCYVIFDDGDVLEDMTTDEIRASVMVHCDEDNEHEYESMVETTSNVPANGMTEKHFI
jgi:TATA-box binding protein (TBP) (component of TFIID and TFIIIB)